MSDRKTPRQQGILLLLTALLFTSGSLRLGLGWSAAQALTAAAEEAQTEPVSLPQSGLQVCGQTTAGLLTAFQNREAQLAAREAAVSERIAALSVAEEVVRKRLAELESAETSLAETLSRADGAAEGDLAKLTSVYEAMKPKEAAALFATMDAQFAAGFLGRLRPEAAAAILSGMEAEAAYAISALLAGRNARVPTR